MGETSNIAKIAEIISKDIFSIFLWKKTGPTEINWPCEEPENHEVKKHPADIVFSYNEPYIQKRTYVHCDLKSYASNSITKSAIEGALVSLSKQIACAEKSKTWQENFANPEIPYSICGLLFIYNHDGSYDKNLKDILKNKIDLKKLKHPAWSKIFILGPDDIFWLNNVANNIIQMRGKNELPGEEYCKFYYPQLIRNKNIQMDNARAATLEMLTSPFIFLEYVKSDTRNFIIYYKGKGEKSEEFTLIIEYIRYCQLLESTASIKIKLLKPYKNAAALFERAKHAYIKEYEGSNIAKKINSIEYESIKNIVTPQFSEIELGMNND